MAELLYGTGARLIECCRLRVKDIDLERGQIVIRSGKGDKDRVVMLPRVLRTRLEERIAWRGRLHQRDLDRGVARAELPFALHRKYPNAAQELAWQFLFASKQLARCPRSGAVGRHPLHENGLQRAVKTAVRKIGLPKRVSPHTFRHCFATHLIATIPGRRDRQPPITTAAHCPGARMVLMHAPAGGIRLVVQASLSHDSPACTTNRTASVGVGGLDFPMASAAPQRLH